VNQIALPLDIKPSPGEGSYLVTEANLQVHEQLKNWSDWPHQTAILFGPPGSGKTAMAAAFAEESGGHYLDDAADHEDVEIFHLWNRAREEKRPLLLVSGKPVAEWGAQLPDLKSRLAASLLLEIGPPDQAMIEGLLQQFFARRGLAVSGDALAYLGKRMTRSYANIHILAQKMDTAAIARKKPVTIAIARAALNEQTACDGQKDEHDDG